MTNEEKQLLLKDLCARLPYHPKGVRLSMVFCPKDITIVGYSGRFVETVDEEIEVERVRLYLRPMSSMTDDERKEWYNESHVDYDCEFKPTPTLALEHCHLSTDWLLKHHFDFRGLIPLGLALEAPEGMYKTE